MVLKRLSCVLRLTDCLNDRPVLGSEAVISVDGQRCRAAYKTGGFFVLTDLPEGTHIVGITSWKFQSVSLEINVDYSKMSAENITYVMMTPGVTHPGASAIPCVSGTFGEKTDFYVLSGRAGLKIAEDGASEGKTRIKLFSERRDIPFPSMYLIKDKSAKKNEFVILTGREEEQYLLGEPLKFAHPRSTALIPLVKYTTGDKGDFFASAPWAAPVKEGAVITLLVPRGGELAEKELPLRGKGISEVGEVKL